MFCDGIVIDTASVSIVYPAPTATAIDDNFNTVQNVPLTDFVATNDTPCSDGAATTYQQMSNPANGTVTAFDVNTGEFTYSPTANFTGSDRFVYEFFCDGNLTATANVNITIAAFNADAVDDSETGIFGTQFVGDVTGNDVTCDGGATATYELAAGTENGGTAVVNANGSYTFDSTLGFVGTASFNYNILCNGSLTDTATVSIVFAAPTAIADADSATIAVDTTFTGDLALNDTPCSSGTTAYALIPASESNGTVTAFDPNTGIASWTPDVGFVGIGSFDYAITCNGTQIDTANVVIVTEAVTATATDDSFTGVYNGSVSDDISPNDVPCNYGVTTYAPNGAPTGGTLDILDGNTGTFTFSSSVVFIGNAIFQYDI